MKRDLICLNTISSKEPVPHSMEVNRFLFIPPAFCLRQRVTAQLR